MRAVGVFDVLDPLRVVVVAVEAHAASRAARARLGRHVSRGLALKRNVPWPSRSIVAVVAGEDGAAVVEVDVVPEAEVAVGHHDRAAAGRAVAHAAGVGVQAEAGAPVVLERPVHVDVAAAEQAVAAEVPARPLVEVDHVLAHVLAGRLVAPLQPVVHRALVGAALEAEVVRVEARALVAVVGAEAHAFAADLRDADGAGVPAERRGGRVERQVVAVGPLEVVHGVLLQAGDRLGAAGHAAAGEEAGHAVAAPEPPVVVDAADDAVVGQEARCRACPGAPSSSASRRGSSCWRTRAARAAR